MENLPLANDSIRNRIYEVRGVKVMLDRDPEPIPPVGYQATLDRENNKKK